MEKPENRSAVAGSKVEKLPWERPTVTLAGTVSLLVRGGSAGGKTGGNHDGDSCQFQASGNPQQCPNP